MEPSEVSWPLRRTEGTWTAMGLVDCSILGGLRGSDARLYLGTLSWTLEWSNENCFCFWWNVMWWVSPVRYTDIIIHYTVASWLLLRVIMLKSHLQLPILSSSLWEGFKRRTTWGSCSFPAYDVSAWRWPGHWIGYADLSNAWGVSTCVQDSQENNSLISLENAQASTPKSCWTCVLSFKFPCRGIIGLYSGERQYMPHLYRVFSMDIEICRG